LNELLGLRPVLLLHFRGVAADSTMLPATRLKVTAYGKDGRRYHGPNGALSHGVLNASTPYQVRGRDYGERHRESQEKPTNPERCSHARISVRKILETLLQDLLGEPSIQFHWIYLRVICSHIISCELNGFLLIRSLDDDRCRGSRSLAIRVGPELDFEFFTITSHVTSVGLTPELSRAAKRLRLE
jgi:hypothetical protein